MVAVDALGLQGLQNRAALHVVAHLADHGCGNAHLGRLNCLVRALAAAEHVYGETYDGLAFSGKPLGGCGNIIVDASENYNVFAHNIRILSENNRIW